MVGHGASRSRADTPVPNSRRVTMFFGTTDQPSRFANAFFRAEELLRPEGVSRGVGIASKFKFLIVVSSCNDDINWASSLLYTIWAGGRMLGHGAYMADQSDPLLIPFLQASNEEIVSLKMLKSEKYRDPFYWASFVVVGDGR